MMQLSSITVSINDETNHQDITQLHFDVSSQFSMLNQVEVTFKLR